MPAQGLWSESWENRPLDQIKVTALTQLKQRRNGQPSLLDSNDQTKTTNYSLVDSAFLTVEDWK